MLNIESEVLQDAQAVGSTYLNMSAVLFEMEKFSEAYEAALKAKDSFISIENDSSLHKTISDETSGHEQVEYDIKMNTIVAYYNMGLALEKLGDNSSAENTYSQGYHLAAVEIGEDHSLTRKLMLKMTRLRTGLPAINKKITKKGENEKRVLMRTTTTASKRTITHKPGETHNLAELISAHRLRSNATNQLLARHTNQLFMIPKRQPISNLPMAVMLNRSVSDVM